MSEYLLINILVISVPAALSFDKNLRFYKKLPALGGSILSVGFLFIIWDAIATKRGDWSFNPDYLMGLNIFVLPLEEILFFITVPYSIIFLYETSVFYLNDKEINVNINVVRFAAVMFLISGIIFFNQYYTFTVLIFVAASLIILSVYFRNLLRSRLFWLFMIFTYIPFFLVNYFLTSLPIVTYSSGAIWGIRFTTIPFEDFFYSFSLLSLNLMVYLTLKKKWIKEKK